MRLQWARELLLTQTGSNMALSRLPNLGAMRSRMLKVKAMPSIKLTDVKTTTGPQLKATRNLVGSPITRGEMI
jgi:hypothetical protein